MKITDADRYARRVLDQLGLRDWSVAWMNDVLHAARCTPPLRLIEFSRPLVLANNKDVMRELVIHEAAHAWTPGCEHNEIWQTVVQAMGGVAREIVPMLLPALPLSERDRQQLRVKFNARDVAILGGDPSL
jgi:hypothetical protein